MSNVLYLCHTYRRIIYEVLTATVDPFLPQPSVKMDLKYRNVKLKSIPLAK